jgi:ELWxxDGT repeat protein
LPKRDAFFSTFDLSLAWGQALNGRFVFVANDGPHGVEPWITDGTPKGTRLLRDIYPGAGSSSASPLHGLAGRLYFAAADDSSGQELWSTDGTQAGTRRVLDLCPGLCSSYPGTPFVLGDRLLFMARDGQTGEEIWSTDGTAEATVRISDFEAAWDRSGGAVLGGQFLFEGSDGQHGKELWRTDGTPVGTWLVEDINRLDIGGSFPRGLRPLGHEVVFAADDGETALWKSDGTCPGPAPTRPCS